jgi:acetyl-CoA acetyltransferase
MDVFVIGQAVHPPAARIGDKRLEELVFDTAHAALKDAAVSRAQIDHVTIAGCDELDGRPPGRSSATR